MFDKFWHKRLGRPYRLKRTVDSGKGTPVVLLHGIGRSGRVWTNVIAGLSFFPYRIVAFDLLGFGDSPKPKWIDYTVDDHAAAVIASLERLRAGEPAVLVGHSMGCLVAIRVAVLRPDLVRHLVMYEMPLYDGLPEKRLYRWRLNLYRRIYQRVITYQPSFDPADAWRIEKLAARIAGFELDRSTWRPFVKSLENTILAQKTIEDIRRLDMPMDVIYGTLDMLVIRGEPQLIFGTDKNITSYNVRARHEISPKASKFLVQRIVAALQPEAGNV
jgi:pimeloyl-ACP methyl ester carboxylesterase